MIPALLRVMAITTSAPALSASITSGGTITENVANGAATSVDSSGVTALGGEAPYTYDWEYVSGDVQIVPTNDANASTTWGSSGTNQIRSAAWRCKVTDNVSAVAYTSNVAIQLTHGTPP